MKSIEDILASKKTTDKLDPAFKAEEPKPEPQSESKPEPKKKVTKKKTAKAKVNPPKKKTAGLIVSFSEYPPSKGDYVALDQLPQFMAAADSVCAEHGVTHWAFVAYGQAKPALELAFRDACDAHPPEGVVWAPARYVGTEAVKLILVDYADVVA